MASVVNGIGPQLQSIKDVYQPAAIVKALAPAYESALCAQPGEYVIHSSVVDVKED